MQGSAEDFEGLERNEKPQVKPDSNLSLSLCPFCGETENIKPTFLPTTEGEPWKAIRCMSCGATGPIIKDGLEANSLWNTRVLR